MMTRDEGVKALTDWFDDGCVGNITFFRSPFNRSMDAVIEETIKLREMDNDTEDVVRSVFHRLDSEKVTLYKDKHGQPDRVKVIRRA